MWPTLGAHWNSQLHPSFRCLDNRSTFEYLANALLGLCMNLTSNSQWSLHTRCSSIQPVPFRATISTLHAASLQRRRTLSTEIRTLTGTLENYSLQLPYRCSSRFREGSDTSRHLFKFCVCDTDLLLHNLTIASSGFSLPSFLSELTKSTMLARRLYDLSRFPVCLPSGTLNGTCGNRDYKLTPG